MKSLLKPITLFLLIVLLTGCTALSTPAAAVNTPTPGQAGQIATLVASALPPAFTPTPTFQPFVPLTGEQAQSNINPLTGLPVEEVVNLERRPVMIKVSNFPVVGRPHAGLSFADIVYEYYIGEYINRFLAVFYGQDAPQVGPVRSGRLIDVQLVSMYQGVLAYGSADERVDEAIKHYLGDRSLAHTESPCPPICGFDPHSAAGTFADSGKLTQYLTHIGVDNARPDLSGMVFDPNPPASDQMGVHLGVQYATFNRGEWRYDPETARYRRWIEQMDGQNHMTMIPLVDRLTGEQLQFSNVAILFAFYVEYNRTLHNIDFWNNTAGRRAVFFRDGVMTEGLWQAADRDHPPRFFDERGEPYALKPGNTWIVIAGLSSTFEQVQPGQWEMYFYLP